MLSITAAAATQRVDFINEYSARGIEAGLLGKRREKKRCEANQGKPQLLRAKTTSNKPQYSFRHKNTMSKRSFTSFSDSPRYFAVKVADVTLKNVVLHSVATAFIVEQRGREREDVCQKRALFNVYKPFR